MIDDMTDWRPAAHERCIVEENDRLTAHLNVAGWVGMILSFFIAVFEDRGILGGLCIIGVGYVAGVMAWLAFQNYFEREANTAGDWLYKNKPGVIASLVGLGIFSGFAWDWWNTTTVDGPALQAAPLGSGKRGRVRIAMAI